MKNKEARISKIPILLCIFIIFLGSIYYRNFFKPKNTLELYQELAFDKSFEDVQKKLMEKGYEDNITVEDLNAIQEGSLYKPSQFTMLEYYDKTFVILTTPGSDRLKILSVTELPDDIRQFFSELVE